MSRAGRAVVAVVVIVAGLAAAAGWAVSAGVIESPLGGSDPEKILVIAAAEDESGADYAAMAYVVDVSTGQVTLVDTLEQATVAGTSAGNAAEALPFGGGEAVAQALVPQTGGEPLEWVVVPAATWMALVGKAGGVTVEVPGVVSAYTRGGGLSVLEPGRQRLTGAQALALATAVRFAGTADEQREVSRQLTAALSAVMGSRGSTLRQLVESGEADSSLEPDRIPVLTSQP